MAKAQTTRPSGLSVTRSGSTFTLTWKQGGSDYKAGQQMKYRLNTSASWVDSGVSVTATSYTITDASIWRIDFMVRGKKKSTKTKTCTWSAWVSGAWEAAVPDIPTLEYDNGGTNLGTFTWSCANDATSNKIFTRVEAQTTVVRGNAEPSDWGTLYTKGASGSQTIVEDSSNLAIGNLVRWYRVRSYGPRGYSGWRNSCHAYGAPLPATLDSASAVTNGSTSRLTAAWRIGADRLHPVDLLTLQYVTGVPTDAALTAPANGWSNAIDVQLQGGSDKVVVNIDEVVGVDECMWARVVSTHDSLPAYSNEKVAQIGALTAPTLTAVPDTTAGTVAVTITEETDCEAAATAIFFRSEDDPSNDRIIAILPRGTTTASVTVPGLAGASTTCFGAYAFVGTYSGTAISEIKMRSDTVLDSNIAAVAPTGVTVTEGPKDGTVRISWNWSWDDATAAELSWSDDEYAWESTAEPSSYTVEDTLAKSWIISDLDVGKRWYFRVRLIDGSGDDDIAGPWSSMVGYNLSSVPDKPALTVSKNVVNEGETFTARWAFGSSDGTDQQYAEICLVTFDSEGVATYGDVIAHAEESQSAEITQDWTTGSTYYLAVRVTSASGIQSDWSDAVSVYVANPVTINMTGSSLPISSYTEQIDTYISEYTDGVLSGMSTQRSEIAPSPVHGMTSEIFEIYMAGEYSDITTEINGSVTTITTTYYSSTFEQAPYISFLPITATITGAGTAGTTTLSVIRAEDRHLDRPDGRDYDGYEGEVIATVSQLGEGSISITANDLVGSLDDGGMYYLVGKVVDEYGQSASFRYPFFVDWMAKPTVPSITVEMDKYQRIAKITPIAGAVEGNQQNTSCDIYRLSADRPELIIKDATFGETYVDPYPAFNEPGGHRLVSKSLQENYTTDDGFAWYDADLDDGDYLKDSRMVVDVDGQQIVLPYNIELANSWSKDFQRTEYLGGSVQGDWNPAVTRDLNAKTVLLRGRDLDEQLALRGLADYAGAAHIRTPDGSSFACDIQVRENIDMKTRRVSYTLAVKAVDPEEPEGMTLEEWETSHPAGE